MELNLAAQTVSTGSGLGIKEFQLDTTIAMVALREKIYADPVKACVQEYMSNARDANREAGRGNVPIEVLRPTADHPCIVFKDNGIGINPDRMDNVFTCYGKSTKRDSNSQTGGWGLGCKAGFAVADQFTVVTTWAAEDGKLFTSTYLMLIAENQRSTYAKLSEQEAPADRPTGTEIHLPIDPDMEDEYFQAVVHTGRWWGHPFYADCSALPVLTWETDSRWGDYSSSLLEDGDNWRMNADRYVRGGVIILDGIEYELRTSNLKRAGITDDEVKALTQLLCFYRTGEIMVTATREDIDYGSAVTVETIRAQADKLHDQMQAGLDALLAAGTDYLAVSKQAMEMRKKWGELFIPLFKQARFQHGDEQLMLFDFDRRVNAPAYARMFTVRSHRGNKKGFEIDKVGYNGAHVTDDVLFVVQDVSQMRNSHIRGVLQTLKDAAAANPNTRHSNQQFFLICPEKDDQKIDAKVCYRDMGLEFFNFGVLSQYPRTALPREDARMRPLAKHLVRVYDTENSRWFRTERSVKHESGGVYVFYYKNTPYLDRECTEEVSADMFRAAVKLCKRVYGVQPDAAPDIHASWTHFSKWQTTFLARAEKFRRRYVTATVEFFSEIHDARKFDSYSRRNKTVMHPALLLPDADLKSRAHEVVAEGQFADYMRKLSHTRTWHKKWGVERKLGRSHRALYEELRRYDFIRSCIGFPAHLFPQWQADVAALIKRFPLLAKLGYASEIMPDVRAYVLGKVAVEKSVSAKSKTKTRIRP